MISAAVVGSTGYAGAELVRILQNHPNVQVIAYGSQSYAGMPYAEVYPSMRKLTDALCTQEDLAALAKEADVIFTATPQGYLSGALSEDILSETKVIDLSADFRLKDVSVYEKWYGIMHPSPQFLPEAVYGLVELCRENITQKTRLLANPGCYCTCSILTVYPLVAEGLIDPDTLIIDAASGVTGAGRSNKTENLFCEVNENMKPYGVGTHRHTPEIEQQLSVAAGRPVTISFTPHLAPMMRGILVTAYASVKKAADGSRPDEAAVRAAYEKYYGKEPFIRLLQSGECPQTRCVKNSNFTDIGFVLDERTNRIVMMGALDNLVKGAAGQAVQNLNRLFGLDEREGLLAPPAFL